MGRITAVQTKVMWTSIVYSHRLALTCGPTTSTRPGPSLLLSPLPHTRPDLRELLQLLCPVADHADHLRAVLPREVVLRDIDGQEIGQALDAVVGGLEVADQEAQVQLRVTGGLHDLLDERQLVGQVLLEGGRPGDGLAEPLSLQGLELVAGVDLFANGGAGDDGEVVVKVLQRLVGDDGGGQKGLRAFFDLFDTPLNDLKDVFLSSVSSQQIHQGAALVRGALDPVQRSQCIVGRLDHQLHPQYILVEKLTKGSATLLLLTKPGLSLMVNFPLDG